MTKVIYAPAANDDLLGITRFIAHDNPVAARQADEPYSPAT